MLRRDRNPVFGIDSPVLCMELDDDYAYPSINQRKQVVAMELPGKYRNQSVHTSLVEKEPKGVAEQCSMSVKHEKKPVLQTVCENVPLRYTSVSPPSHDRPACPKSQSLCLTKSTGSLGLGSSEPNKSPVIYHSPSSDEIGQDDHRIPCSSANVPVVRIEDTDGSVDIRAKENTGDACVETGSSCVFIPGDDPCQNVLNSETLFSHFNKEQDCGRAKDSGCTKIHVELTRAKSCLAIAEEEENKKENKVCFASLDTLVTVCQDGSQGENNKNASYDPASKRRGARYWGKLRSMFKVVKPSSSMPNLSGGLSRSTGDMTSPFSQDSKTQTDSSSESLSENTDQNRIKKELSQTKTLLSSNKQDNIYKKKNKREDISTTPVDTILEEDKKTDDDGEEEEDDNFGEDAVYLDSRAVSKPLPIKVKEPTYSLVSSPSELDETTINFTRIPSFRGRLVHIKLERHFSTHSLNSADVEDSQNIKDATDIQPLNSGEAIVTDMLSNKMVLYNAEGSPKITFAVESGSEPWATCLTPDGAMAVTLKRQGCVALWATSGEPMIEFGQATLSAPTGIRCDSQGRYIVSDEKANGVFVFNKKGKYITKLSLGDISSIHSTKLPSSSFPPTAGPLKSFPHFNQPRYICITHSGNYVIADSANHCVRIFDSAGSYTGQFGGYGRRDGQMKFPYGVASDQAGNIYVADHYNNRVSLFTDKGVFIEHLLTSEKDGITRPKGLAVMNSLLYLTYGDLRSNKISVYSLSKIHERQIVNNRV
ncbi:uncharacterized protein LOC101853493 isoform X2 [Aplysia californica]|nr:uncharacterized protein LOC101853493 isoform X2 [Aplysia californica]